MKTPAFTMLLSIFPMTLITFHTLAARAAGVVRQERAPSVMTESVRAAAARTVLGLESGGFAFVVNAGGETLVVIHNNLDRGVRKGAPRVLGGSERTLLYPLDERRLTTRERAWQGRAIRLFDDKGAVCDARVASLAVWTRIDETISNVDEKGAPMKPREQDALVLRVAPTSGNCEKARFARDASLPAPGVFTASENASQSLREKALASLRKLRAFRKIQKRYVAEVEQNRASSWDKHEGATMTMHTYSAPGRKTAFVGVAVNAGAGCGEFGALLSVVFEVAEDGKLVLRSGDTEAEVFPHAPAALIDFADGKGLAVLGDSSLIRHADKEVSVERRVGTDFFHGCGC